MRDLLDLGLRTRFVGIVSDIALFGFLEVSNSRVLDLWRKCGERTYGRSFRFLRRLVEVEEDKRRGLVVMRWRVVIGW